MNDKNFSQDHFPVATYRIQFNPAFGFSAAQRRIPFLSELGISTVYASPIFKAKQGSMHGYDVVDPQQLNAELGSPEEFESLCQEVRKYRMGWLQDIVPNHMAYNHENRMLMDIFERREQSPYYDFFDVDWVHIYENFQGRILAPFLGRFYSEALEDAEIQLSFGPRGFSLNYYDHNFPLYFKSYRKILMLRIQKLVEMLGETSADLFKYYGIVDLFDTIPAESAHGSYDRLTYAKNSLWELYSSVADIKTFLDDNVQLINGEKGHVASFQVLDELLSEQCFRLSFWKVASEELNYRRFFTINDLISLRVEKEDVFSVTHALIQRLIQEGRIHGLRIDHIDGLYDPQAYLNRLRQDVGDIYIVAEKILAQEERLAPSWPIQGTTGYDFLNAVNGVFCRKDHEKEFNKIYFRFTKLTTVYEQLVVHKKRLIIGKHMAGDIDNLAYLMKKVASRDRYGRDITLYGLRRALVEVMSFFPVYRTYISQELFTEQDRRFISQAIMKARQRAPGLCYEIHFIEKFLLLDLVEQLSETEKNDFWHFIKRFQQLTAPIMAKGFEDTMFYTYNKLISLNEVGGEPSLFGLSLPDFHAFNGWRQRYCPFSMNATATHDTKRGEDVRARINVLSEIPVEWKQALARWKKFNRPKKHKKNAQTMPDANDEYFIYQTLLGTFPSHFDDLSTYKQRIRDYIIKSVREAKVHTAWIKPDSEYEKACVEFFDKLLEEKEHNAFLEDFLVFKQTIEHYGLFNSLSQVVLKITSPGVPDFYQGTELWDFTLVDPDNRRPVDFDLRDRYMKELKQEGDRPAIIERLLSDKTSGAIKFFVMMNALEERQKSRDVYGRGEYIPLETQGRFKDCLIAYARVWDDKWSITIVPRFLTQISGKESLPLGHLWQDTKIILPPAAPKRFKNIFTHQVMESPDTFLAGDVFSACPVALLVSVF